MTAILPATEFATADPPFVFLHHFGGSARPWGEVMATMADEHRCVAADMPGFGQAALPTGFTVKAMVDQLAAFVETRAFVRSR